MTNHIIIFYFIIIIFKIIFIIISNWLIVKMTIYNHLTQQKIRKRVIHWQHPP